MTVGHAVKTIVMWAAMLLGFAAFVMLWITAAAVAFVVGRWCAKLLGWY